MVVTNCLGCGSYSFVALVAGLRWDKEHVFRFPELGQKSKVLVFSGTLRGMKTRTAGVTWLLYVTF